VELTGWLRNPTPVPERPDLSPFGGVGHPPAATSTSVNVAVTQPTAAVKVAQLHIR